jgi:hypothetical protein
LFSCQNKNNKVVYFEDEKPPQLVVSFLQSVSDTIDTPDYVLKLYNNRQMHLEANRNIDKNGLFFRTLSEKEYDQVIETFEAARLEDMKGKVNVVDSSRIKRKIIVEQNGDTFDVVICDSTPSEIVELELVLKSFLDRVGWNQSKW